MGPDSVVLVPYKVGRAGRRFSPLSLSFLALYSAATGIGIVVLPPDLIIFLGMPIVAMAALIFWLLPDGARAIPVASIGSLLGGFVIANCLWPNYIALDIPGAPWINPPRLVVFILLAISLWSYSTSKTLRSEISAALASIPLLRNAFWLFWSISLITVALSTMPLFSLNKWFNNQIFWTFLFILSAWLFTKPGTLARLQRTLVWTGILISLEAIYEYRTGQVPWMGHIPSFLSVDQAYLSKVLQGGTRAGTDIYRARGTFSVSLILAEYLAMIYPFLIHAMMTARTSFHRAALGMGLLAGVTAMWLTGARSGMIGFFMSIILYVLFVSFRHWRRYKGSLIGISAIMSVPVACVLFVALALTWPRLHNMTIGGGQHQPSTLAREEQWSMGWPKIISNPVGHGTARAATTLGFTNGNNTPTIDSYYLSLLLEYGVLGFATFVFIFTYQAAIGLRLYLSHTLDEESIIAPVTIALTNFIVIKSVLSSEFNLPIAFIFLGIIFAVTRRRSLLAEQSWSTR